jgi:hypothetical protein
MDTRPRFCPKPPVNRRPGGEGGDSVKCGRLGLGGIRGVSSGPEFDDEAAAAEIFLVGCDGVLFPGWECREDIFPGCGVVDPLPLESDERNIAPGVTHATMLLYSSMLERLFADSLVKGPSFHRGFSRRNRLYYYWCLFFLSSSCCSAGVIVPTEHRFRMLHHIVERIRIGSDWLELDCNRLQNSTIDNLFQQSKLCPRFIMEISTQVSANNKHYYKV